MSATVTIQADTRGLSQIIGEMAFIFRGRGAGDSEIAKFVKTEAALLAADAADAVGPHDLDKAKGLAKSDVKKFLDRPYSDKNQSDRDFKLEQESESYAEFTWLYAGPKFLLGINNEDDMRQSSVDSVIQVFRAGQKTGNRGNAYVDLGKRGNQHIVRLNRTLVSKSAFASVVKKITDSFGKAKASFAATAEALGTKRKFPAWVTKHFSKVREDGRLILDESGMFDTENPSLVFGSTAPGVVSNPKISTALESAAKSRAYKAKAKLEKLIAGAAYNLNKGTVYFNNRRGFDSEEI